jgi:hypothetical protein
MQNLLREQPLNKKQVNLLEVMVDYLGVTSSNFNRIQYLNVDIVTQLLDTLTESAQGPCKPNQQMLSKSFLLEYCSRLLHVSEIEYSLIGKKEEEMAELKQAVLRVMMSLLEGVDPNVGLQVPARVRETIESTLLLDAIQHEGRRICKQISTSQKRILTIDVDVELEAMQKRNEAFCQQLFALMKLLDQLLIKKVAPLLSQLSPSVQALWEGATGSVELLHHGRLEKCVFTFPREWNRSLLPKHHADDILWQILWKNWGTNKANSNRLLADFVTKIKMIHFEYEHRRDLHVIYSWLNANESTFQKLSLFNALLMNAVLLFGYHWASEAGGDAADEWSIVPRHHALGHVMRAIGCLQILLMVMKVVLWRSVFVPVRMKELELSQRMENQEPRGSAEPPEQYPASAAVESFGSNSDDDDDSGTSLPRPIGCFQLVLIMIRRSRNEPLPFFSGTLALLRSGDDRSSLTRQRKSSVHVMTHGLLAEAAEAAQPWSVGSSRISKVSVASAVMKSFIVRSSQPQVCCQTRARLSAP